MTPASAAGPGWGRGGEAGTHRGKWAQHSVGRGKKLLSPHPSGPTAAPGCLFSSSASPQLVLPLARRPPEDPDPLQPGERLPLRHLPPGRGRGGAVRGGSGQGAGAGRGRPGHHPCQSFGEQKGGGVPPPQKPCRASVSLLRLGNRGRAPCLRGSSGPSQFPPQITWGPTAEKTSECAFKKKSREVRNTAG